jgi:hypothetical protein
VLTAKVCENLQKELEASETDFPLLHLTDALLGKLILTLHCYLLTLFCIFIYFYELSLFLVT